MITIMTTTIDMTIATAIAFAEFPGMVTGTRMKYKRRTCEIKQLVWSSVDEITQNVNQCYRQTRTLNTVVTKSTNVLLNGLMIVHGNA